ncbi:hypothetical protein Scep_018875 [Stephania cephalantha]|uniref:RNase H type-1 domain-containing protein n=1 Tax=Stephania cephalantha TaxID=152367 RepID=A0AAP0NP96_9MAGN
MGPLRDLCVRDLTDAEAHTKVHEYVESNRCWDWEKIGASLSPDFGEYIQAIPPLDPTKGEDFLVRNFDKQGRFNVKSAFDFLVNVDGSNNVRNGETRAGCVIHNADAEWIAGFMKVLGRCLPITAELWAMLGGLQLCAQLGF